VLGIASLGVFMAFVDATIVNVAFPNIERSFSSVSVGSLSWVLNAYNIVFAAFLVAAGRIGDLLGRRRIFLLGMAVFTFASALCAIAPSAAALIAFRIIQAIGAAMVVPSALALVLAAFPPERHAHAVALFSAVGALAAGVGPSLGGLLVTAADWRLVFLVNVPIGAAAIVLSRRELVESRAPGYRRMPDLVGALVFAGAIATLVLGVVEGQGWGWTSPRIIAAFAAAVGLGVVFVRRCTWHRSPLVDLGLLRIRTFSAANAMTVLAAAGFYGYTLCNVLFLTAVWHYSILQAGLAITPGPFVAAAVAGPTSRLAERRGHRPVLVIGGLIWGAAVIWFVERTGVRPDYLGVWLPGMILLGIGAGSLFPNLGGAAVASTPGEGFATATSLNSVARQVGAAIGVAVVIAIIGTPSPSGALAAFHHAWAFGAAMLLGAGLGCLAVGRVGAGEDGPATPSLGAAARAVLGPRAPEPLLTAILTDRVPGTPTMARRSPPESTAEFLGAVSIFAGLPRPQLEQLAEAARAVRLPAGDWLFHEGEAGDAMYIVRAGRLEVVSETEPGSGLRVLGRGDVVGELALLSGSPRAASVRASRSSDLIEIRSDEFERMLIERPEVSLGLAKAMAAQLRESRPALVRTRALPIAIALVALDQQVPVARLGAALAAAIGRYANVTTLTGSETQAPPTGASPAAVYAPLLDRCSAAHDHVVMIAGQPWEDDPWTDFCLQQADRILAIGSGADSAAPAAQRVELVGCDLVAWNVAPGSGGLGAWAAALDPIETHAWRSGPELQRDLLRSARRLTGRSIGIVLSGGGARAFSHIGVLDELVAAGITIDRVAGASMGAYIGAMFAMGLGPDEIDARCYEEWVRRRPLSDYSFPRHALIRGQRGIALVNRSVGSVAIEELALSFTCHATDLRSGEAVLSRSGPLQEALERTMCIPIIAPPRVRGGRLLVDGALVDNLPIERMAALGEGPIIAADVKASLSSATERSPTSEAANERPERLPTLGETVMRVVFMGSTNSSEAAQRHSSLLITSRPPGIGLLEFHQIDHAREAGRQAARAALATPAAAKLG
jgi:EmrB/QacA subfamily drug resistance transporter